MTRYDLGGYFGRVRMRGATRLDFVQRMSSGDVLRLTPGQGAFTCFTTPNGRMVDRTLVLCESDSLLLLTGGGNQAKLIQWLRKYVFFNDDVQLTDETPHTRLAALFDETLPAPLAAGDAHAHARIDDRLWVNARLGDAQGAFVVGSDLGGAQEPDSAFDARRIAAGVPRFPNELNDSYIPLEAGMWDAVSFKKGCYIGQEIIARMESRNQIAKRLARLDVIEGVAQPGDALTVADAAEGAAGGACGTVTSAASAHALAYVRSAMLAPGVTLSTPQARLRIVDAVKHG